MPSPLNYQTPAPLMPPVDPERERTLRTMAAVLLGGAVVWALVLLVFVLVNPPRAMALFGPGYLLTFGYGWRVFGRPTLGWRRAIWGTSLVVQAGWLGWVVVRSPDWAAWRGCFTCVMMVWWSFSAVVSAVGLVMEPEGR